jgi:hypothetical protein
VSIPITINAYTADAAYFVKTKEGISFTIPAVSNAEIRIL